MRVRRLVSPLLAVVVVIPIAGPATAEVVADPPEPIDLSAFTFVDAPPVDGVPTTAGSGSDEVETASAHGCPTPPNPRPAPRFRDVPSESTHAANIECVARWGIAQGTSATTYGPRRDVTRGQMASFVANLIRAMGASLPEGRDRFADDDGSPHETNINALANAGVVSGVGGNRYDPGRNVTRAQAATILANAYRFLRGVDLPIGRDRFRDDNGSPHEDNINRLANAGVINGRSDTVFGHADPLKRDQMASLLARFLAPALGGAALGSGTVWYSEYGELRAIDAANPTQRRLVYEFGILDQFTVNTRRNEFVYYDDGPAGERLNEVYVRATSNNALRTTFRWAAQCGNAQHRHLMTVPLASPDGQWFIAEMDNGFPYNTEIRDRNGDCVLPFARDTVVANSWDWFANGDLLVVADASAAPDISGDWALIRFPRQSIANQTGNAEVLRTFNGTNPPFSTKISNDERQIAYHWDRDLYVFDLNYAAGSAPASRPHHRVARSTSDLMYPAFSPDDRAIVLRHRTSAGSPFSPSRGQVHAVTNHRGSTTLVQTDGPTQLAIPDRPGQRPQSFDAKGPIFWQR